MLVKPMLSTWRQKWLCVSDLHTCQCDGGGSWGQGRRLHSHFLKKSRIHASQTHRGGLTGTQRSPRKPRLRWKPSATSGTRNAADNEKQRHFWKALENTLLSLRKAEHMIPILTS